MNDIKNTDVLIVGSGLSGLTAALMLPDNIKITIITKGKINQCSTSWAQGGIAAVLASTDSFKKLCVGSAVAGLAWNKLDPKVSDFYAGWT